MNNTWQKLKIELFPLTSYYFYRNPDYFDKKDKGESDRLLKELYREVRSEYDRRDRIDLIMDSIYEGINGQRAILGVIEKVSGRIFTIRDEAIAVREVLKKNESVFHRDEEMRHDEWFFLNRMVDEEILKCSYISKYYSQSDPQAVIIASKPLRIADLLLEKVLMKGMSETHMHAGAGRNISYLWIDLMNNKKSESYKLSIHAYEGEVKLRNYLLLTRLMRMIIALMITGKYPLGENVSTDCGKCSVKKDEELKKIEEIIELFISGEKLDEDAKYGSDIINLIDEVMKKFNIQYSEVDKSEYDIQKYVNKKDCIYSLFDDSHEKRSDIVIFPETVFLLKSFYYMQGNENDKFIKIFTQYIRMKNMVYSVLRQPDNSGKGLDIFKEYYGNQSKIKSEKNNLYLENLYTHCVNANIKKIEMRVSPGGIDYLKRELTTILNQYLGFLKQYPSDYEYPLLGLVIHFIKKRGNEDNCYHLYSKSEDKKHLNYGELQKEYDGYADDLIRLLNDTPGLCSFIVGIDTASGENDAEPFVFRRIFERFRENGNNRSSRSLGFTYHVGEDFRDIISGLRHIDEVIDGYSFIPGDRIGHGIVLGMDVERWSLLNETVCLTRGEYLDNMLWEWGLYSKNEDCTGIENIAYLENRIMDIAGKIYGHTNGITVRELYDAYYSKFENPDIWINDECVVKDTKFLYDVSQSKNPGCKSRCFPDENSRWNIQKLIKASHCEYFIRSFKKLEFFYITSGMVDKYKKLQEIMKRKINNRGIVVEVNPTSNLLIGDFVSYNDFHIENLSNPFEEKVIITVNTDDPVVFNTTLSNEYALLQNLLLKKEKYTRKEVIDWIDKIRNNSNDFSFIADRRISKSKMVEEVSDVLKNIGY